MTNEEHFRRLTSEEITRLLNQGCSSSEWEEILIHDRLDLHDIINVRFSGSLKISKGVVLRNIPGGIGGCEIEEDVTIENVASITFEKDSTHGSGIRVAVLDETGSRAVPIYPGLSSQIATLISRVPKWLDGLTKESAEGKDNENPLRSFIDSRTTTAKIGQNARIRNCGSILNVSIGREITVDGATRLVNGSLINNAQPGKCFTYVGAGVVAENFILEDSRLETKSSILNCYVGQGSILSHGFFSQDSLFFANCSMENGEAHALLACPFTVSMHKGTLLIGCQTSFMNAGSLTYQSNHMYKLGPVHWGVLERGVKTASGSYLMLGAKIGAYSLLMGLHKTHPDSSEFPFSYLFGDERGYTIVVPGIMLRSCGLQRDELKWPARDRRLGLGLPLFDRISFKILNPFTIDTLLKAIPIIDELLHRPPVDDQYMRYKGMKFTRAALERARSLYTLAIFKYLSETLPDGEFPSDNNGHPIENDDFPISEKENSDAWVDLGGQIITRMTLSEILASTSIMEAEEICTRAFVNFEADELKWINRRFGPEWHIGPQKIREMAKKFDAIIEEDRQEYLENLSKETDMLEL